MKKRVLLYLVLVAFACACAPLASAQTSAAAWSRYTYRGEEFSVELPGMPSLFNTVRAVGRMPFGEERVRVFSLYRDEVVYFVVAYDAPRSHETFDNFATWLRGAWGLAPKGELTLSGSEGRAYAVTGTQRGRLSYDLRGEGRVFRTKRHAYLALAVAQEEGRPEVARFLDSFALGSSPAGERIDEEEEAPPFVPPQTPVVESGRMGAIREPLEAGDRRAQIVYKPEPGYTEEARRKHVSGNIILRAVLSADGTVTDIEPTKWLPNGLTERAIRVARRMRFFPAKKNGQPVEQRVILEYNFSIY